MVVSRTTVCTFLSPPSFVSLFSQKFLRSAITLWVHRHGRPNTCDGCLPKVSPVRLSPVLAARQNEHLRYLHPSWRLAKSRRPKHLWDIQRGQRKENFLTKIEGSFSHKIYMYTRQASPEASHEPTLKPFATASARHTQLTSNTVQTFRVFIMSLVAVEKRRNIILHRNPTRYSYIIAKINLPNYLTAFYCSHDTQCY